MTAWWLLNYCPMIACWLDDCSMTSQWLPDDCPMTALWLFDDCPMTAWWLPDKQTMTFLWLSYVFWWPSDDRLDQNVLHLKNLWVIYWGLIIFLTLMTVLWLPVIIFWWSKFDILLFQGEGNLSNASHCVCHSDFLSATKIQFLAMCQITWKCQIIWRIGWLE